MDWLSDENGKPWKPHGNHDIHRENPWENPWLIWVNWMCMIVYVYLFIYLCIFIYYLFIQIF